jgi:hypothetical protein
LLCPGRKQVYRESKLVSKILKDFQLVPPWSSVFHQQHIACRITNFKLQREKKKKKKKNKIQFHIDNGGVRASAKERSRRGFQELKLLQVRCNRSEKKEKKTGSHYRGRKNREMTSIAFFRHHSILKTYFGKRQASRERYSNIQLQQSCNPTTTTNTTKKKKKTKNKKPFRPQSSLAFFSQLEKCRHPSPQRHR